MKSRALQVGILVNSREIPAWQSYLIKSIVASDYVNFTTVFVSKNSHDSHNRKSFLFDLFEKYGSRSYSNSSDAMANTVLDSAEDFDIESVNCAADKQGDLLIDARSRDIISALDIDVFIILGSTQLLDQLSALSKLGALYYWIDNFGTHHTDGCTSGFYEVLGRRPYICSELRLRQAAPSVERVAYKSRSAISLLSHTHSRNQHLWKAALFPARAIKHLFNSHLGTDCFAKSETIYRPPNQRSNYAKPLNAITMIAPLLSYLFWRLRNSLTSRLFQEHWAMFFGISVPDELGNINRNIQPHNLIEIRSPKNRFWADPQLYIRDDKAYVFYEDASTLSGHGRLAVVRINVDGSVSTPRTILEESHHLSYPYIFEWRGELFLVPESGDNAAVSLYRCVSFPDKWQFEHHLMPGITAYDATLFHHGDLWWMFANVKSHPSASSWDEMCLYYADSPTSKDWHAHPLNPVVSDVRSARPAGKLFESGGRIYRPTQNSSYRYGFGLNIMEITKLSITEFQEALVEEVIPFDARTVKAIHTYNRSGSFVVTDAIIRRRRVS